MGPREISYQGKSWELLNLKPGPWRQEGSHVRGPGRHHVGLSILAMEKKMEIERDNEMETKFR